MELVTEIIIIVACLVLSGFFSGSETALMRLRMHEVERDLENSRGLSVIAARDLISNTSRLLITILLGNNVVNILGSAVASAVAVQLLGPERGIIAATIVMTVVVLIFSELLPKALAARSPKSASYFVSVPLYLVHQLLRPAHFVIGKVVEPVIRMITGTQATDFRPSPDEILELAKSAVPNEGDEDNHSNTPVSIIRAVADAASMTVDEIMVSRAEMAAFPVELTAEQLLDQMLEERYTRVPVYSNDIDHIVGVIHLKDLVAHVRTGGQDLHTILKPVLRVPERKPILRLLADMQRGFLHMAIVKDEFGLTEGLVTQEDILEELVGEIRDEFDAEELQAIKPIGEGGYEAIGRLKVLDFNRETNWDVPAEPGDTLGGLVFNTLGRAPRRGDLVSVPGYSLVVNDVSGARITRLSVFARNEDETAKEAEG